MPLRPPIHGPVGRRDKRERDRDTDRKRDPALLPVLPGQARFTRTFWMSMPAEAKHQARMQATWAFVRDTVQGLQDWINPAA